MVGGFRLPAFSTSHVLCSNALSLFYVREVGLPGFVPGLSFSIKTAAKIVVILTTPAPWRFLSPLTWLIHSRWPRLSAFLVLSQVSSLAGMIAGAALEGIYYGLFAGVSLTFVQNLATGRMARANTLYVNSLFIGALVAGPSVGVIAHFTCFQTVILAACAPMVPALIALVVTTRTQTPAQFRSSE